MWSFVQNKKQQAWQWLAISRRTRQVVAYVVGKRTLRNCRKLWKALPYRYRKAQAYSDFWKAYKKVWGSSVTQVGKDSGQTSYIERFNGTLRQRLAQFVRRTLSFSKCWKKHLLRLELFLHRYNLDRARNLRLYGTPFGR